MPINDDSAPVEQLDLLGATDAAPRARPLGKAKSRSARAIGPATIPDAVKALASEIGPHTRYGTSTWSYPGWSNIVYDETVADLSSAQISRTGLPAYAEHPLLGGVGLDRTHYGPLRAADFEKMAAQVPRDFRFVVKAHEASSLKRWPLHARYGEKRGTENPLFLDADYATEVVSEMVAGFSRSTDPEAPNDSALGLVLFQFAPQDVMTLGGPAGFARRLNAFLLRLPTDATYAVEVRNAELQSPAFADACHDAGAICCLSVLPQLASPFAQAKALSVQHGRAVFVRWMVPRESSYAEAKDRFLPYAKLKAPDLAMRDAIARVVLAAERIDKPCYVVVNNLAEGSAPRSIAALLATVRDLRKRALRRSGPIGP